MKTLFIASLLTVFSVPAFADQCESGQYVIFSASCKSATAKVQIIGKREPSVMTRTLLRTLGDGSQQCRFSGEGALLDKIEYKKRSPEYAVYGC